MEPVRRWDIERWWNGLRWYGLGRFRSIRRVGFRWVGLGGSVASGGTDSGGRLLPGVRTPVAAPPPEAPGGPQRTDSGELATQAGKDSGLPNGAGRAAAESGGFLTGLVGDGLWGDVTGAADAVLHPVASGRHLADQVVRYAQSANDKWSRGDRAGAAGDLIRASTGAGRVGVGLPGSGSRVGAVVQQAERDYLNARIPRRCHAGRAQGVVGRAGRRISATGTSWSPRTG